MKFRGVRGATTVSEDTGEAIWKATRELMLELIKANEIEEDDVASVIFTTTPDLTAAYPAKAARDLGWHRTALMGCQEMDVPNGIPMCIRVLIHWNTTRSLDEIQHVYMKGAMALRPDLYPDNKIVLNGEGEIMIVVMKPKTGAQEIADVIARVKADGYDAHLSEGEQQTIIGVVGESPTPLREENYSAMEGVEKVVRISAPYKLASRHFHPNDTEVPLNGSQMGGNKMLVIAGPCSVESREQIIEIACELKEAGATALRGGAFKPRTSPYSFQGHGEKALEWLAEARQVTGLPIVTEVMDTSQVEMVCQYADVLQIGARNMQNFSLLNAVGESQHTILLKRGMSATVEDLLMSAEYILSHGNNRVMLCERGIRTFEKATRNTFDVNAIPVLKALTHLPVVADPSHGTGYWEYVESIARAAVAAGADGLIVEVHATPDKAISDGRQSLKPDRFKSMMDQVRRIAEAVGRTA